MRFITLNKGTHPGCSVGLTVGNTAEGDGVLVVRVKKDSLAKKAGIQPGDIILKVNSHYVGSHSEAVSLIDRSSHGVVELGLAVEGHAEGQAGPFPVQACGSLAARAA